MSTAADRINARRVTVDPGSTITAAMVLEWARGVSLSELDLTGANLSGVDLSGADLRSAILTFADLSGADLTGANLLGADLSNANLAFADLTGANLTGANLHGTDVNDANLTGATLDDVDLSGAKNLLWAVTGEPADTAPEKVAERTTDEDQEKNTDEDPEAPARPARPSVWALVTDSEYGVFVTLHPTRKDADTAMRDDVRGDWDPDVFGPVPDTITDEDVQNLGERLGTSYTITETPLP